MLAVMVPGEDYTTGALATQPGWSLSTARTIIHAAEDTGIVWKHRCACKGPLVWVRRDRMRCPSRQLSIPAGELQGYEQAWRSFRDICMLAHASS
ncbi:hypothetical protein FHX59_001054 [Paraburkholderia silvatlantica]|uniref:Uncharacterized protein n=1 Tax=Paraburkholderia silvatlantica TaxID=321895 RepID=A0ABR6FGU1_9BURK|nr:hypothetical protein [Paraburkholderia silvatlantica]PVY37721.1 hypothetical protein C7411_101338 [Paraburkholderia silvatlantica]PXW42684.1 hypothetical protein C7413_101339 [Paraburkholderia silvatlantica]